MKMEYLLNGQSLVLDGAVCNGCGRCQEVCPHDVFRIENRKAFIAHREQCMECGACRMNCLMNAIQVSSGVGCAAALVSSMRRGDGSAPSCECG